MIKIIYPDRVTKILKNDINCISKIGESKVFIAMKNGKGFQVEESLQEVEYKMERYGTDELTGVFKEKTNGE